MRVALVPAAYVYLRRDGQVLLQLRQNTGYLDGHWAAGAAGHVEFGEHAATAALRELREELGVDAEPSALQPLTVMHRTDGVGEPIEQRVDWFYALDEWDGEPHIVEPYKCARIDWFDLDDLPNPVVPHEHAVLEAWADQRLAPFTHFGFDEA